MRKEIESNSSLDFKSRNTFISKKMLHMKTIQKYNTWRIDERRKENTTHDHF